MEPSQTTHTCMFHSSGFTLSSRQFRPCGSKYHAGCIRVGPPFTSRLIKGCRGLEYPSKMTAFPYICESCSVRAILQRELENSAADLKLLSLERMRSIDMAHNWATSTMDGVSRHLAHLNLFGTHHGITICPPPLLQHPSTSPIIPILWAIEDYTLKLSTSKRVKHLPDATITYNSARHLQSAASAFFAWSSMLQFSDYMFMTTDHRIMGNDYISPTDLLIATFTNKGMKTRLGATTTPSVALQYHHVQYNLDFRCRQLQGLSPTDLLLRYDLVAACLTEILAWGGWLRASELFNLTVKDITVCLPENGARHNLPPGVGALFLKLLPTTKSSQFTTADVILASSFSSGLSPLFWWQQTLAILATLGWNQPDSFVFRHTTGVAWDSAFFRHKHLYPLLRLQQLEGDHALSPFNDEPGNTIADKFYSFHTYRRGGRTHVSRHRPMCRRAARKAEVDEHGRWRSKGKVSADMATHYREWTVEDRIYITLLCM